MTIEAERIYSARVDNRVQYRSISLSVRGFSCTGLKQLHPVRPQGFMKVFVDWMCNRLCKSNGATEVTPLSENIRYTESNVMPKMTAFRPRYGHSGKAGSVLSRIFAE